MVVNRIRQANQDLLVRIAGQNSARVLQQTITQGAFPMINVCNDAKVSISLDRYGCNPSFKLRD